MRFKAGPVYLTRDAAAIVRKQDRQPGPPRPPRPTGRREPSDRPIEATKPAKG